MLLTLLSLWYPSLPAQTSGDGSVRLEHHGDSWQLTSWQGQPPQLRWQKKLEGWGHYLHIDRERQSPELFVLRSSVGLESACPTCHDDWHFFRLSDGREVLTGSFTDWVTVSGHFILTDTLEPTQSGEDVLDAGRLSFRVFDAKPNRWLGQKFELPSRKGCGASTPATVPEIDDLNVVGSTIAVNRKDGCGSFYVTWNWTQENAPAVVHRGTFGK